MPVVAILFHSAVTAQFRVAGIPAAARSVRAVCEAVRSEGSMLGEIVLGVPGGWSPSPECRREIVRLVPGMDVRFADSAYLAGPPGLAAYRGEYSLGPGSVTPCADTGFVGAADEAAILAHMRNCGSAIVAATGKASDGLVSRYFNRPISMAITRLVLRIPGIGPMHATAAAAIIGLAMTMLLLQATHFGLIAGAILFKAASIIDGVDGEIARATFRTSDLGAKLDSLTDAATNLAFLAGLSFKMYLAGQALSAGAGLVGLIAHGVGFFLLGRRSVSRGAPMGFDALKHATFAARSRAVRYATYLMTRDFYAAASVMMVLCGYTSLLLPIYAAAATLWLAFVTGFLFHSRVLANDWPRDGGW